MDVPADASKEEQDAPIYNCKAKMPKKMSEKMRRAITAASALTESIRELTMMRRLGMAAAARRSLARVRGDGSEARG